MILGIDVGLNSSDAFAANQTAQAGTTFNFNSPNGHGSNESGAPQNATASASTGSATNPAVSTWLPLLLIGGITIFIVWAQNRKE